MKGQNLMEFNHLPMFMDEEKELEPEAGLELTIHQTMIFTLWPEDQPLSDVLLDRCVPMDDYLERELEQREQDDIGCLFDPLIP
jgi:hypothetical protein